MPTIQTRMLATAMLLAAVALASAATIESGVVGVKLILLDKYPLGKAKAVYVAKGDPGIEKGSSGDPPGLTGTVEIFPLSDPGNRASYALPAEWLVNKDGVAKYVNKNAASGGLGAKVVVIKPEVVGKLVAKNLGDGDFTSGDQGAGDLDLQALTEGDTIRVTVTVQNGHDGNTYVFCSDFAAPTIKRDGANDPFKLVAKTSTAPGTCAVAPTTTTVVTTTTTSSTTTTTTLA
jgi:hypothetical protein